MIVSTKPPGVLINTATSAAASISAATEASKSHLQCEQVSQEYTTQWRDLQMEKPFALWIHKPNGYKLLSEGTP